MPENEPYSFAGDVLKNLFDKILPDDFSSVTGFFSSWEEIAGFEMALHVRPVDIINNQLILESSHPGWSQRAEMQKGRFLGKIRKKYPELEIEKIKIVLKKSKY